jgi:hypothetical protein
VRRVFLERAQLCIRAGPSGAGLLGIVLATVFLVVGWAGKVAIAAIVFLVDPSWFHGAAEVRWPEPTFRNFVAVALLAVLASRPHAYAHGRTHRGKTGLAPTA